MFAIRCVILTALGIAIVGSLSGCSQNPATGRMQLRLLPADQVSAMGMEAKPQLIQEYGGEVPERQLRAYVTEVGMKLAQHVEPEFADVPWSFTVLDSDVINAFALPGGNVFISRGLLARFDHEAQLAGVLGHEIGHVTAMHIDERLSQHAVTEFGLAVGGSLTDSQLTLLAAQLGSGALLLRFGRNQESEADILGVRYMAAAGYDPQGMLDVLEVLREASAGAAQQPEFFSTHPHPETRINTVNNLLRGDYAYTQNNPAFGKYENRFQQRAMPYLRAYRDRYEHETPVFAAAMFWCAHCQHAD
jgi:predicted Zn-dependent protease